MSAHESHDDPAIHDLEDGRAVGAFLAKGGHPDDIPVFLAKRRRDRLVAGLVKRLAAATALNKENNR